MKDKICAKLTKDHMYVCNSDVIGRIGENNVTQFEITLDECLCDYWVYLDFVKTDGSKYKTERLNIVDNKITYDIPSALLSQKGTIKVQVVLQNEAGEIWKSTIKTYSVNPSINATDEIPYQDDFITKAQKVLNEISENAGNIYVGKDEPVNEDIDVWIDPTGEPNIIPTKTSQLENDSKFIDEDYLDEKLAKVEIDGVSVDLTEYAKKTDIPDVSNFVTKGTNELTNYYSKTSIDNMIGDIESLLGGI